MPLVGGNQQTVIAGFCIFPVFYRCTTAVLGPFYAYRVSPQNSLLDFSDFLARADYSRTGHSMKARHFGATPQTFDKK